ncbi:hypothetical protein [Anaerococcus nagyae]|uniref:hypothetical protein n=1 Tax=Anaerococcus nagyae TaxID=1755241 RepID=UPI003243C476
MTNIPTTIMYYNHLELDVPKICPHCHKEMIPTIVTKSDVQNHNQNRIFAILVRCNICSSFYAVEYIYSNPRRNPKQILVPYDYSPTVELDIPDNVKEISEDFEDIYTQSETAYQLDLKQIAGMGYRKSIEFLVKDFLIFLKPDDTDRILNLTINKAISEIGNQKLQDLARMTNYLANDQVHIKTLHPTKDVDDLRDFLKNLVYLISFEINYHDGLDTILSN